MRHPPAVRILTRTPAVKAKGDIVEVLQTRSREQPTTLGEYEPAGAADPDRPEPA